MEKKKETKLNNKEKYSKYFIIICAISLCSLLVSNITSIKTFSIGKIILPSSALLFPITYIVGDIIAEVYGYKKAKFVILLGFACNAFMVLFFALAIKLPPAISFQNQDAFSQILGTTPKMFIASVCAFLSGSLSNAYVMNVIKKLTKGKLLFLRTIGSTIVGEALDTIVFVSIAFTGSVDAKIIIDMMLCQFLWKVGYEILATPLTYKVINKYKELENN